MFVYLPHHVGAGAACVIVVVAVIGGGVVVAAIRLFVFVVCLFVWLFVC